jgi:hypothetical protein
MASEPAPPAGAKAPAVRKSPLRPRVQRKKKPDDDWQPSLKLEF